MFFLKSLGTALTAIMFILAAHSAFIENNGTEMVVCAIFMGLCLNAVLVLNKEGK